MLHILTKIKEWKHFNKIHSWTIDESREEWVDPLPKVCSLIYEAFDEQGKIGCGQAIQGRISKNGKNLKNFTIFRYLKSPRMYTGSGRLNLRYCFGTLGDHVGLGGTLKNMAEMIMNDLPKRTLQSTFSIPYFKKRRMTWEDRAPIFFDPTIEQREPIRNEKVVVDMVWGNNKCQLLVISVYQVSKHSPKGLVTETCFMQQWRELWAKQMETTRGLVFGKTCWPLLYLTKTKREQQTRLSCWTQMQITQMHNSHNCWSTATFVIYTMTWRTLDTAPLTYHWAEATKNWLHTWIPTYHSFYHQNRYSCFHNGLKYSDHQAVSIDLSEAGLFRDSGSSNPISRKTLGFQTSNRKQAEKILHIKHLEKSCWQHTIHS